MFGLYEYELYNLSLDELEGILVHKNFKGLNITIPYKKIAAKYCDYLDDIAKRTATVNTIVNKNGQLFGYNTDYYGLKYTIENSDIDLINKKILILGTGGTCATAKALAYDLSAKEILTVSRQGNLNYSNIYTHSDTNIIINTTPVGMFPNNSESLVNLEKFEKLSAFIDVIYNPIYTHSVLKAKELGIATATGLPMLVAQAKVSAELFKNIKLDDKVISSTLEKLSRKISNLVLIGMSGSGKTTLGKILARKLKKNFIDTDEKIENMLNLSVSNIFKSKGETFFREVESEVIKKFGKLNGQIISTGGGSILNKTNYKHLKQNSRIYYIKRDLESIDFKGRPLLKNKEQLKKIFKFREPLYLSFCDKIIENDETIESAVNKIEEDWNENTCY